MRSAGVGLILLILAAAAQGQVAGTEVRFDVVSIKSVPNSRDLKARGEQAPVSMANAARIDLYASLETLIRKAFLVKPYQKLTGPDWMRDQWFEISARLPEGATQEQVPEMLRVVLVERLSLVMRRESKEQTVYILAVGKDGPHLKEAVADASGSSEWRAKLSEGVPLIRTLTASGLVIYARLNGNIMLMSNKMTMPALALALVREVGQPVFDQTGLNESYEISMPVRATWLDDNVPRFGEVVSAPKTSTPSSVNIMKSVEQLGLQLQKSRAPIESFTVERVDKHPTEN